MRLRLLAWAIVLVSLINIMPLLIFNIGGDLDFHLVLIKCFAGQFWQGDLYPRWCLDANSGLGSPAPLFYFPLPYYVAALLYPFTWFGVSLHGVYILCLFLATGVTIFTCYLWLKDVVSPERALLAGILFVFMPYRMEAMLFRSAYAEIFGMALVPLVFKYVRQFLISPSHPHTLEQAPTPLPNPQGGREVYMLAAVFGLLFITHLPSAAVAIIGSGIYMLTMSGKAWMPKLRYAASILWGAALAAFYFIPAVYYQQFLVKAPLFIPGRRSRGWPNTWLTMDNVSNQTPLVLMIALTILALIFLSCYIVYRRARIGDAFVRREACVWTGISVAALFLLFPISAPAYALLGPLSQVVFPWRMQQLFMLALLFFMAVWMQWLAGKRRLWKGDFAAALILLILMTYCVVGARDKNAQELAQKIAPLLPVTTEEYRTRWTDAGHFNLETLISRYHREPAISKVEIISGKGSIKVERWAWDGIVLQAHSAHGVTVRLNQFYFPVWLARADDGEPVAVRPEAGSGQMLLDISAGKHRIILHYAVSAARPWPVWLSDAISVIAALGWLGIIYRRRSSGSLL